ncbi:MAG: VOC family protein [Bifidobacteriaceae bacterium]|jgi:Asp-tRNA(Asn)/Glu-tRNA(Gln) amidotransferase A subunit family amidase|nr:VOC family protein [Bifidobacteriaceae bacterium]
MSTALSSNHIVKIGIVTPDVEDSAARCRAVYGQGPPPRTQTDEPPAYTVKPYFEYRGQRLDRPANMKVISVYTDNFWFEFIEPLPGPPNPWQDHLDAHGLSVAFVSAHIDSGFERDLAAMESLGYPVIWTHDKGYERYAYFDTADRLGFMVEVKELQPR